MTIKLNKKYVLDNPSGECIWIPIGKSPAGYVCFKEDEPSYVATFTENRLRPVENCKYMSVVFEEGGYVYTYKLKPDVIQPAIGSYLIKEDYQMAIVRVVRTRDTHKATKFFIGRPCADLGAYRA